MKFIVLHWKSMEKYGKVCQSNKININTLNIAQYFMYNLGDSCTSITNGWTLTKDSCSNFITESNSIHAQRTGGAMADGQFQLMYQ